MPSKANICVDRVPFENLAQACALAEPWLTKGSAVAEQSSREILRKLFDRKADLWLITNAEDLTVCGALITTVHENDTGHHVHMSALAGRNVWAWAHRLHAVMYQFALDLQCNAVRFWGRKEWARFFPDCRKLGVTRGGHELFERAIP